MKGLLFIPEMAVAACEGRKTQTRRVIVPQPPVECGINYHLGGESWLDQDDRTPHRWSWEAWHGPLFDNRPAGHLAGTHSVKMDYIPGERRCLLATWAVYSGPGDLLKPTEMDPDIIAENGGIWHAGMGTPKPEWAGKLRPGRFLPNHLRPLMPVFEVGQVRAERVKDMSEEDAQAEGVTLIPGNVRRSDGLDHYSEFASLWDRINFKRGFGWSVNPWVFAIAFKKVSP